VTAGSAEPLSIALVHHASAAPVAELADSLRAAGHRAEILTPGPGGLRSLPLGEKALRFRGFADPLTHVPSAVAALRRGGFDVAHAFSPQDAMAALAWRRLGGGPVVFSTAEPVARESMANARLAFWMLQRALSDSDAVAALTEESRAAMWRWLAIEVPLIEPGDASGWERVYREARA
jgi:hypothetical protein